MYSSSSESVPVKVLPVGDMLVVGKLQSFLLNRFVKYHYSATSKLVLRHGGLKQDPTLGDVSTECMWPWLKDVGGVF